MDSIKTKKIIEKAIIAFDNSNAEDAFELLNRSLLEDSNSVDILNALGDLNYLSDNMIKALDYWDKSLAINYSQVDILFNTALIYQQNNEHRKALDLYSRLGWIETYLEELKLHFLF